MKGVTVVSHPLARHYLTILRDRDTGMAEFRRALEAVTGLLVYEATRSLAVRRRNVTTPLVATTGTELKREVLLVPILRAGLGMLESARRILPETKAGFIGLKRNETTLDPETYYLKLPDDLKAFEVLLLDPMLATGGSCVRALQALRERGARQIRAVHLLAAPAGVRRVRREFPELPVFTAALDKGLNARGYIVPGLGDAGDRLFGA